MELGDNRLAFSFYGHNSFTEAGGKVDVILSHSRMRGTWEKFILVKKLP